MVIGVIEATQTGVMGPRIVGMQVTGDALRNAA